MLRVATTIGVRAAIIAIGTSRHNHRSKLYQAREAAHSATAPLPGRLEPRRFVPAIRDMGVTWIEMATGSAANNTATLCRRSEANFRSPSPEGQLFKSRTSNWPFSQ